MPVLDQDNWLTADDNYIENPEFIELKLAEGALNHVAAAICKKVTKIYFYNFTISKVLNIPAENGDSSM